MGGPGSTRWGMTVTRMPIDGLPQLDVRVLNRVGALNPSATSTVTWGNKASITLSVPAKHASGVRLDCVVQSHCDAVRSVRERIRLTRTTCTFGGTRVWFGCPGCGTRCAVLRALGGRFRCRACHRLAYASTHQGSSR